ncbi:carboxylesterase/lipase family protein [Mucilaginibacter sp.]|uniref:carboxylesterase/lipase family protein n=1 Tax=Mucilaginibacter sp. TaxID=1882438 RepID=UPI003D0AC309
MSSAIIKSFFAFLFASIIVNNTVNAQATDPVVKTNKGYIRGVIENDIAVFKGVPYAAAPVGALRFMPAAEHTVWTDTLSTQNFGSIATQASCSKVSGTEDCLSLNLYTPKADNHKRAVMVWVHGGSMTNGAGKGNDGHAFADRDDIVAVTINYRLGAFGFLYMGDVDKRYAASGNNGLLDCVMALKWIKQNIAAFGGDPERVTIMGESAGAKLISAVLVSPASKGLFQQYIAESGSVQCIRDTVTAKNERTMILKQMGLGPNDARKLLTLPADSIMKIQGIVCAGIGGNSFFGPVYDGVVIKEDAYHYASGKDIPRIKALIGTNQYEAALFVSQQAWQNHPDTTILKPLFKDNEPLVYKTYLQQVKTLAPYAAAVNVLTQYMYQMHSYRFAKILVNNGIPVWMYHFEYSDAKEYGARHAAELQYVWNDHNMSITGTDAVKKQLAIGIHGAWVAFIKTGNPNVTTLPQWPLYKNDTRQVMTFDTVSKVNSLKEVFDDKAFPSAVFVMKK